MVVFFSKKSWRTAARHWRDSRGLYKCRWRGGGNVSAPAVVHDAMVQPTLLRDAKFSRQTDLAPGATSADGSAAMRVCVHNILETPC
jgi:hypothetical protein